MNRQLDHMVRLIDDLLDVSRISRGVLELQEGSVDLGAIVTRAVETVAPARSIAASRRSSVDGRAR